MGWGDLLGKAFGYGFGGLGAYEAVKALGGGLGDIGQGEWGQGGRGALYGLAQGAMAVPMLRMATTGKGMGFLSELLAQHGAAKGIPWLKRLTKPSTSAWAKVPAYMAGDYGFSMLAEKLKPEERFKPEELGAQYALQGEPYDAVS